MRSKLLVAMILSFLAVPVFAADSKADRVARKDRMSPERTECIQQCKTEKDVAAHEVCLSKCPKDLPKNPSPGTPAGQKK